MSTSVIDLRDYAVERDILPAKKSISLQHLVEKVLHYHIPKSESVRISEGWEEKKLDSELLDYAALDVYACYLLFEAMSKTASKRIQHDTPPGTRIALCIEEGGEIVAYGTIAAEQPSSLNGVRVKVPSKNRVVINIDHLVIPSAAALLHFSPSQPSAFNAQSRTKTKSGNLTLGQLQAQSSTPMNFQVVTPLSLLRSSTQSEEPALPSPHQLVCIYLEVFIFILLICCRI
jgi:hypothetical protein